MIINMLKIYNKEYRLMSLISFISIISLMEFNLKEYSHY